jgi:hypothetical protein
VFGLHSRFLVLITVPTFHKFLCSVRLEIGSCSLTFLSQRPGWNQVYHVLHLTTSGHVPRHHAGGKGSNPLG